MLVKCALVKLIFIFLFISLALIIITRAAHRCWFSASFTDTRAHAAPSIQNMKKASTRWNTQEQLTWRWWWYRINKKIKQATRAQYQELFPPAANRAFLLNNLNDSLLCVQLFSSLTRQLHHTCGCWRESAEKIDANEFFTSSTFFVPASNNFTSKQLWNVFTLQRKFLINESGAELLCKYSLMNDGSLAAEWVGVIKIEQFPR